MLLAGFLLGHPRRWTVAMVVEHLVVARVEEAHVMSGREDTPMAVRQGAGGGLALVEKILHN